jgi:hypothetical protein
MLIPEKRRQLPRRMRAVDERQGQRAGRAGGRLQQAVPCQPGFGHA